MTTFLSASNLEHIHRTVAAWLLFLFLLLSFVLASGYPTLIGAALALDEPEDTEGPVLVDANYIIVTCPGCPPPPTSPEIYVVFDEAVDPFSATDVSNYTFFKTENPSTTIEVVEAQIWPEWHDDEVYLLLAEVPPAVLFTLTVSGVQDTLGNVVEPGQFIILEPGPTFPNAVPPNPLLLPILLPNVPNPFNPATQIRFHLPADAVGSPVLVDLYDIRGRWLRRLWDDPVVHPGVHEVRWNGEDGAGRLVASGEYIVRLLVAGHICSRKITLAR